MSATPLVREAPPAAAARASYGLRGRVLFFVNDAQFFVSHRLPLARAARTEGMEVHVATPAGAAVARIVEEGFVHHEVPLHRWSENPVRDVPTVKRIYAIVRQVRPRIVHNVTIKPLLYGTLVARAFPDIGIVNAIPGLGTVFVRRGVSAAARRRLVLRLYRLLFRDSRVRVILQNREDFRILRAAGVIEDRQASLIRGSGVDLQEYRFTPLPQGMPIVMLAARMLWEKGVREFVDAARALLARGVSARFVLVGDSEPGNPSAVPRAQLEAWASERIVEWWGRRADMPSVLAQASLVCLPSTYGEGVPKVLLEAAACGRPLIATDTAGCREAVRHGINGLLVAPADARGLAGAIREILGERRRAEAMGRRSRQIAELEFGVQVVVDKTLGVYRDLLGWIR